MATTTTTKYSLTLDNQSGKSGNFCIYTTIPDEEKAKHDFKSLAWFTKCTPNKTKVEFEWDLDYSLTWCQAGKLTPEVKFKAYQEKGVTTSGTSKNSTALEKTQDAYRFYNELKPTPVPGGSLDIETSSNIPNGEVSIGLAIGGKTALAAIAQPNLQYTFTPNVKYWVAFGDYEEGEVLDLDNMTKTFEIKYDTNVYDKTVILTIDNLWVEDN